MYAYTRVNIQLNVSQQSSLTTQYSLSHQLVLQKSEGQTKADK